VNRETLRSAAFVLVPLALLAGFFGACFERRTEEVEVGFSREARENPYLALERLLRRMGRDVVVVDGLGSLGALPPTNATLMIPTRRDTLSKERSAALLDWTGRGGHLMVVTYTMWDEEDRRPDGILDRFGLQQHWARDEDEDEVEDGDVVDADESFDAGGETGTAEVSPEEESEAPRDPAAPQEPELDGLATFFGGFANPPMEWDVTEVPWEGRDAPLLLHFDPRFHWIDADERARWGAFGSTGAHLLSLDHGAGWITALTDDWLLRSDEIEAADHAEFLVRLVGLDDRDGPVWIVVSTRWPGLWSQATKYAAPALLSLAALGIAWLWRASRRFGPIAPAPPSERRRWIEHLEAVGRYHWREGRGRALVRGTRQRVEHELARRRPQLSRLAPGERVVRIAELADLSPTDVLSALESDPAARDEFTTTIANLERIRASL
jgi:hypothetical protein